MTGGVAEFRGRQGIVLPLALIALVALGFIASSLVLVAGQQRVIASRRGDLFKARLAAETALVLALARWEPGTEGAASEPWRLAWTVGTLPGVEAYAADAEMLSHRLLFIRATGQADSGTFAAAGLLARLPDLGAIADAIVTAVEAAGPLFIGDQAVVAGSPQTLPFEPDPPCPDSVPYPGGALRLPESAELRIDDGANVDGDVIRAPPGRARQEVAALLQLADHRLAGGVVVAPATQADVCVPTPSNWGAPYSSDSPCASRFPFLHATGPLEFVAGAGQGILYAAEELRLRAGTAYFGLILAAGAVAVEPGALVRGAIVAEGPVHVGGVVSLNRCLVAKALRSSGLNRPVRNPGRAAVPVF